MLLLGIQYHLQSIECINNNNNHCLLLISEEKGRQELECYTYFNHFCYCKMGEKEERWGDIHLTMVFSFFFFFF